MFFDWHQFHPSNVAKPAVINPRRRLRICAVGFAAALLVIFGRVAQLEVTQGAGFRAEALRPTAKEIVLPAARGRILARDGTVLACDETIRAVAVEYRWLQEPPDQRWLAQSGADAAAQDRTQKCRKIRGGKGQSDGREG